jgi:hypothetical protein
VGNKAFPRQGLLLTYRDVDRATAAPPGIAGIPGFLASQAIDVDVQSSGMRFVSFVFEEHSRAEPVQLLAEYQGPEALMQPPGRDASHDEVDGG